MNANDVTKKQVTQEEAIAWAQKAMVTAAVISAQLATKATDEKTRVALGLICDGVLTAAEVIKENQVPEMPEGATVEECKAILVERGNASIVEVRLTTLGL